MSDDDDIGFDLFDDATPVVRDTQNPREESLQKIRTQTIPYLIEKFASVPGSEVREVSFLTKDEQFRQSLKLLHNETAFYDGTASDYKKSKGPLIIAVEQPKVFYSFRKILEIILQNDPGSPAEDASEKEAKEDVAMELAHILQNGTDVSGLFAVGLCDEPSLLELLVWLGKEWKEKHLSGALDSVWDLVLQSALSTLYNSSMFDSNRRRLLEVGALETCLPYMDSKSQPIPQLALLCVAHLADEKQSAIFQAKKEYVEELVNVLKLARKTVLKRFAGWSVDELISGIGQLALNDANKKVLAECGAIEVLLETAKSDTLEEQQGSLNALWTLSFHPDIKDSLKTNETAVDFFEQISSESPAPGLSKAAKGILWNVRDVLQFHPEEVKSDRQHIMISYQWDVRELVVKVKDTLVSAGYKIWIDMEHMQGPTIAAMADAVERAAVVLICMSQKYKDSQYCRSEAEYAYTRKKEIIPLVVEHRYKPDGWLGFISAAKYYYNITDEKCFQTRMEALVKALGPKGLESGEPHITPVDVVDAAKEFQGPVHGHGAESQIVKKTQIRDERNWNEEEICEWMQAKGIDKTKVPCLTGSQIHFLKVMKKDAPEYFYGFLERNIGRLNELDYMTTLANALEDL